MSTKPRELNEQQLLIIDGLANDYESLQQLDEMANGADIEAAVWALIESGHVECYKAAGGEMRRDDAPDRVQAGEYWFGLTAQGEEIIRQL